MLKGVRFDLKTHYEIMTSWYLDRELAPVPTTFLPPTGLIIYHNNIPVCSAFLVRSDANAAIISTVISNPHVTKEVRSTCLDKLILDLYELGINSGFAIVCCSTASKSLISRLEKQSFIKTDDNISNFGRI